MPKIPIIEPTGNRLTTDSPAVKLDPGVAATQGKMYQVLGAGTEEAAQTLQKATSLAERTKAENHLETKLADIESRAAQDPDYSQQTHKKYQDEISAAKSEAASNITIPAERNLFTMSSRSDIAKIKVNSLFAQKTKDAAKGELETFMSLQKDKYIKTNIMGEKQTAILEKDHKIDESVKAGFISREDAAKLKIKTNEDWNQAHLSYDVNTNPEFALDELKKGEAGFYRGVAPDFRAKEMEKAQKRLDYLKKRRQSETADNLMVASITKTLTPQMVEEAKLNGSISDKTFNALSKKITTFNIGPTEKRNGPAYMELVNKLVNPATKPEDARTALLEAQAEGKISEEDFKKLYQMHLIPAGSGFESLKDAMGVGPTKMDFDQVVAKDTERKQAIVDRNDWFRSVGDFIQSFTGRNQAAAADITNKVYDKVQAENVKPEDMHGVASKILSQEILKAHPEIKSAPKTGLVWKDAHGGKIRVFPDGTFTEENKK